MDFLNIFIVLTVGLTLAFFINRWRLQKHRAGLIGAYTFPETIGKKVKRTYPHLNDDQIKEVIRGLREYFHLIVLARRRMISMPSQVVDIAWHEFILFTREYEHFCTLALGHFLHHTPAEAMRSKTLAQDGIKRAWRLSCYRVGMNPRKPSRLPILFALDARLSIPDGFVYQLDCQGKNNTSTDGYCATHIGCSSGCAGNSGDGGCGGGCGGD